MVSVLDKIDVKENKFIYSCTVAPALGKETLAAKAVLS